MDRCIHYLKSCIYLGPNTGNLTWKTPIVILKALTVWVAKGGDETIKISSELLWQRYMYKTLGLPRR